jgi:hypothetical protein
MDGICTNLSNHFQTCLFAENFKSDGGLQVKGREHEQFQAAFYGEERQGPH